ncbi:stalk domain-containing protein [Paenibacillus sp. MMO-58]|uniref:stalk domain-containing protein n=1 Tax=Paenibacillus sp. MMO-58 TaxID=3081290 RepID=UPI003018438E
MKKKIAILSVALMVAAAGVASAGAAWGKYKGYDIIRLTVNGKTVKATDAPAISFNNRTMVPIYMLKEAGVNYSWNSETNTVDVKKSTITSGNADTDQLKAYFIMADIYKQLSDLGDNFVDFNNMLSLAFTGINMNNDRTQLDKTYTYLNGYINMYNSEIEYIDSKENDLNSHGISLDKANTVLNHYFDAIDYYKEALDYLDSYYSTNKSNTAFNKYLDASGKGSDATYDGLNIILTEYPKYKNLVLSQ